MDAETIKKLRELAEAATAPRWQAFHDNEGAENREYYIGPLGDGFLDRAIAVDLSEANAAFIAAANPAVILSLIDALDTQSSRTETVTDEHYARGYGLRCMIVDHLNGAIDRDELRRRFTDWEYRCSGTRFSVSPAQITEWSGNPGSTVSRTEAMRKALETIRDCVVMTDRNRVIVAFETDRIVAQVADALAEYVDASSPREGEGA